MRIGYVSPDFREHSVAYFLENLLASHDPGVVEVFCYSSVARPDAVTTRLRQLAPHWCEISHRKDAEVADIIRRDQVDILVDLAGHTAHHRLPLFARKPAPVQVTWLGYPNTTGMQAMDYRITDAFADPPGTTENLYREQLIRLPDCAWCFRPAEQAPPVSAAPVLDVGYIVFGSFNILEKITAPLIKLWSDILIGVPGSRLVIKNAGFLDSMARRRMQTMLENAGITAERVELAEYLPDLADHLASYGRVDIALDTYPYHGTTTTCEALWMGVPVVTLAGSTHASRVGVSLLSNAGLPELIAGDPGGYVRTAIALTKDTSRLAGLRASLRPRLIGSPLLDGANFAGKMERAYRLMWRHWCAGLSPDAPKLV